MSPKVYACLFAALCAYAKLNRPWKLAAIQKVATGEGPPSKYQIAIRQGWMRVVGTLVPKSNNQYTLTPKGATTVLAWHKEGFSAANPPPQPTPVKKGIMNYKESQ